MSPESSCAPVFPCAWKFQAWISFFERLTYCLISHCIYLPSSFGILWASREFDDSPKVGQGPSPFFHLGSLLLWKTQTQPFSTPPLRQTPPGVICSATMILLSSSLSDWTSGKTISNSSGELQREGSWDKSKLVYLHGTLEPKRSS